MALDDGTGAGKPSCWTPILTQWPNRKKNWSLKDYRHPRNQLQTSPTPPLPRENVQHVCCTLYSMAFVHTVWWGYQCSVLCFACRSVVRPRLICIIQTSTVWQYRVQRCQCGREFMGGGKALPYLVHSMDHAWDCTCSTVTLCILHFAGGFSHTMRSTFRS